MELSKKNLILAAVLGATVLVLVAVSFLPMQSQTTLPTTVISIGNTTLEVELAVEDADKARGLSGRSGLSEGKGMLFVFDMPGRWSIWMKDMSFPIDILWADANGVVITIEEEVSPESYPASFVPLSDANYVLEVPAGFVKKHGIATGAQIVVQ